MARLTDPYGWPVTTGPTDATVAFDEMGRGGSLHLDGVSGPLDFDANTGDQESFGVLRWDAPSGVGSYEDCGFASVYTTFGAPSRDWCSALCQESVAGGCVPSVIAE